MTTTKRENEHLMACIDCLMIVANDDASGMDTATETHVRYGIQNWATEGYWLAPGDDTDHFSRQPCEVCNTYLAGERHEIVAIPHTD
jgi:hypothetical protein